jgi:hypothetical protein
MDSFCSPSQPAVPKEAFASLQANRQDRPINIFAAFLEIWLGVRLSQ